LLVDELFLTGSLEATDAYYVEHNAFPKEWLDMQAFLEKVFFFSSFPLLHDVTTKVLK
jgi:hypothetical protein